MRKALAFGVVAILLLGASPNPAAQTTAVPAFEVSSIKLN